MDSCSLATGRSPFSPFFPRDVTRRVQNHGSRRGFLLLCDKYKSVTHSHRRKETDQVEEGTESAQ